ncbi:MAG: tRNA (adenosine(37)-N6)-threonylcarbamoyltransferase complex dimerization subunit type 1 TsaB [Pseudomonadota bacterium]
MLILAVHSSSSSLSVAVTHDEAIQAEIVLPPGREHLERLAPLVRELLTSTGRGVAELDALAVATGPGSFSGIRVGAATAKGMALALKKPVVGIGSLEIAAWQALLDGERGVSVIDAGRRQVYAAQCRKAGRRVHVVRGPLLTTPEEAVRIGRESGNEFVMCSHSPVKLSDEVQRDGIRFAVLEPSAGACGVLAFHRFRNGDPGDVHALALVYVRRSDAEEKKSST